MFGLFKSVAFVDPQLGELRRSRGAWRGTIELDASGPVPLVLSGGRAAPDPEALATARAVRADYESWRPAIAQQLFDHYAPYAEAIAAGELEASSSVARLEAPSSVWARTRLEFVQVAPLDRILTVEIGYRVAWDDEHTLGARFRDGKLLELCGSVLAP